MENKSRIKNLISNIFIGIFSQIGILLTSFIGRTVFVYYLNESYLGINGLYSNILSVLNIVELGLNNVAQFYLYKAVAENNKNSIIKIVYFFRKIYIILFFLMFFIGISLIPVLNYIIKTSLSKQDLVLYYIFFLLNSLISYFSAQNIVFLAAHQNTKTPKVIMFFTNFIGQIFQIIVLIVYQSYFFYILIMILMSIINVILINLITKKKYPELREYISEKISKRYKIIIWNKLKAIFIYKIGGIVINNTDNILISILVNITAVGLYSNYCMIINALQSFISIVTTSLIVGVGNLSVNKNKERLIEVFNKILLFYQFISILGSILLYFLLNDFILFWLGEKFIFNKLTVFVIVFNFYLTTIITPIWIFREANGLFTKVKFLILITAILNIIFSFIFGKYGGVSGVLLATAIARIVTQVWYEPYILYSFLFYIPVKNYWKKQLWNIFLSIIIILICKNIVNLLPTGFLWIILKGIFLSSIVILIFCIGNYKNKEFTEFYKIKLKTLF